MWTPLGLMPQDHWLGGPSHSDRDERAAVMIFSDSNWIECLATAVGVASPESEMATDFLRDLR